MTYTFQWSVRRVMALAVVVLLLVQSLPAQQAGSGGVNRASHRAKPYVVLVSLDGFRTEYLDRFPLPNLRRLMERGTRAKGMRPVFPSLTFPNHYSLVTGLHPGRHGIVANRFYDPKRQAVYALNDAKTVGDGTWYGGEPIWVTAEKQGMVSACFFWPGSEAAIQGVRPTIWNPYDGNITNADRVRTVIEWLNLPLERRPHLITLYFSELDTATHEASLESPAVLEAAKSLDRAMGQLIEGIDGLPVRDQVYLLVTSDHGMVNTSPAQTIALDTLLAPDDLADLEMGFSGPVANLHVRGGLTPARRLRDRINLRLARGMAYLRSELPLRFHYRGSRRAGDVVVVMDESWTLQVPRRDARPSSAATEETRGPNDARGAHGWDNTFPSMQALFLATGPRVPAGRIVSDVQNVDVYSLMAELLGLTPARGLDGRPGHLRALILK